MREQGVEPILIHDNADELSGFWVRPTVSTDIN